MRLLILRQETRFYSIDDGSLVRLTVNTLESNKLNRPSVVSVTAGALDRKYYAGLSTASVFMCNSKNGDQMKEVNDVAEDTEVI